MAGQKGKSGGPREGSGRKSKAEEMGLPELIEECIGKDGQREIIEKLAEKAKQGSYPHMQLLMHYMYGKPQDSISVELEADVKHVITGMKIL